MDIFTLTSSLGFSDMVLLAFLMVWIYFRISAYNIKKKYGLNNFEFWIYYNLIDFYKFEGYPFPEERAKKEIDDIIFNKNKECGINTN